MTDHHQTVRLSPGRHRSADDGACVMELASMLAGEPFSDRPHSVCPIIAAFLRTYNDGIDDERRRDLYRFASEAVGTRDPALLELRSLICRGWITRHHRGLARGPFRLLPARVRTLGAGPGDPTIGAITGGMAVRLARRDGAAAHQEALQLVDRLIGCSRLRSRPASHGAEPPVAAGWDP
jgi:hypothetical protein